MADLAILDNLIQNAAVKTPSENIVDEYFDQIVNCIEQEKINEAAQLIEKVFAKNLPDIRLIVYYLYAHFTDNGIKSFAKTFPLIQSLIKNHDAVLTPKNRTDKHIQSSLNWFFNHLLLKFKYYEKSQASGKEHPVWKKSITGITIEELEQLTQTSKEFNQFFTEKWPLSPTKERVLHVIKKLEEIRQLVEDTQKPSEPPEEEEVIEEAVMEIPTIEEKVFLEEEPRIQYLSLEEEMNVYAQADTRSQETSEAVSAVEIPMMEETKMPEPPPVSQVIRQETIHESLHLFIQSLDNLSQKLKIFETLINKNDYLKAAVVAADIDRLIENFDPLSYFPKLFANYYSLFAKHVAALTEQLEKKESLQVKALERLYRTDLDLFMEW